VTPSESPDWERDDVFDGGDAGCGDLLYDLRFRFRDLRAGTRVLVRALDAGAPVEIPAWCRMTGHRLLRASHPFYLIARRGSAEDEVR
jgi:tRNA 2-thiouridine synthesizing protein A